MTLYVETVHFCDLTEIQVFASTPVHQESLVDSYDVIDIITAAFVNVKCFVCNYIVCVCVYAMWYHVLSRLFTKSVTLYVSAVVVNGQTKYLCIFAVELCSECDIVHKS